MAAGGDAYYVMGLEAGTNTFEMVAGIASGEERSEVLAVTYAP